MSDTDDERSGGPVDDASAVAWRRRRRLAAVFGDVLPETTNDERDATDAPNERADAADRWLEEQVPPHHG